ncbi:hypothetical protein MBLNU230_g5525t1 [Neophaeotheca triangularis]
MFSQDFTFEAIRSSPSTTSYNDSNPTLRYASRSVSPCSTATSSSTSSTTQSSRKSQQDISVSDITSQFASHRLRREALIAYEPCDSYANLDDDDSAWRPEGADDDWFCARQRSRTSIAQRPHSPSRRAQRQVNTRLLCSGGHHAEIARLVEEMVERGEQCEVAQRPSLSPAEEDEGYDSDDGQRARSRASSGLSQSRPRSWDLAGGRESLSHARVSKSVRARKDRLGKRKSSHAVQS